MHLQAPAVRVQTADIGPGVFARLWVKGEFFDRVRDAAVAARGRLDRAGSPFARLDWLEAAAHGPSCPLIARARVSGAEAWLFLARTRGSRLAALGAEHATSIGPVFLGDPDPASAQALLRAIARRLGRIGASRVTLDPVATPQAEAVVSAFSAAGWRVRSRPSAPTHIIEVAGRSFDDYWDARAERLHEAVAAGSRQLTVEVADRFTSGLKADVAQLASIGPFLTAIAEQASRTGRLRLGLARLGDAPVAVQFWLVDGASATAIWRVQDREARLLCPAAQLTAALLRYTINVDGVARVDLGRDADLAHWGDKAEPRRRLELSRGLFRGLV